MLKLNIFRLRRVAFALVAVALALPLLVAIPVSFTSDNNVSGTYTTYFPNDAEENTSCTAGPTGQCTVVYTTLTNINQATSQILCGADLCKSRTESRW